MSSEGSNTEELCADYPVVGAGAIGVDFVDSVPLRAIDLRGCLPAWRLP